MYSTCTCTCILHVKLCNPKNFGIWNAEMKFSIEKHGNKGLKFPHCKYMYTPNSTCKIK